MSPVTAARRGWQLLREATGETRWDDYLATCARDGVAPVTRREFERRRADRRPPPQRCC